MVLVPAALNRTPTGRVGATELLSHGKSLDLARRVLTLGSSAPSSTRLVKVCHVFFVGSSPCHFFSGKMFLVSQSPYGPSLHQATEIGQSPSGFAFRDSLWIVLAPLGAHFIDFIAVFSTIGGAPCLFLIGVRRPICPTGSRITGSAPWMEPSFPAPELGEWFLHAASWAQLCANGWFSHFGRSYRSGGQGRGKPCRVRLVPNDNTTPALYQ